MQMSVTDYCHVSFALKPIMLRELAFCTLLTVNGVECRLIVYYYVDCYRFMLAFVLSISVVFIFILLYHFLRVPCVRISF